MAKATLETFVTTGVPTLVCTRCGWWKTLPGESPEALTKRMDAENCPSCKGALDAVEPRK